MRGRDVFLVALAATALAGLVWLLAVGLRLRTPVAPGPASLALRAPGLDVPGLDVPGLPGERAETDGVPQPHARHAAEPPPADASPHAPTERVVHGLVVDWSGDAVAGARVELEGAGEVVTTDESGRFELRRAFPASASEAEPLELSVTAEGFVALRHGASWGDELRLVLRTLPVLAGRVLTARGTEPDSMAQIEALVAVPGAVERWFTGHSRPGGTYRIEGLPVGELVRVRARAHGTARAEARPERQLRPDETTYLDFTLHPGVRVRGRVIDAATREPLSDALVWADAFLFTAARLVPWDRTDAEGRFELSGVTAEEIDDEDETRWVVVELHVAADERAHGAALRYQSTHNDEGVYEFEIEVVAKELELEGIALDAMGQPLAGARVFACTSQGGCERASSDAEGRFHLANLPGGETLVIAWHKGAGSYAWGRADVRLPLDRGQLPLVLSSDGPAEISGRVGAAPDLDLEGIRIRSDALAFHAGRYFHLDVSFGAAVGPDGSFSLKNVVPGLHNVYVQPGSVGAQPTSARVFPDQHYVEVSSGRVARDVDFRLRPPFSVAGTLDGGETPLQLLVLELRDAEGGAVESETRAGADGSFFLGPVEPELWRLVVRRGKRVLVDRRVGPEAVRDLTLRLPAGL